MSQVSCVIVNHFCFSLVASSGAWGGSGVGMLDNKQAQGSKFYKEPPHSRVAAAQSNPVHILWTRKEFKAAQQEEMTNI